MLIPSAMWRECPLAGVMALILLLSIDAAHAGHLKTLYSFQNGSDGAYPWASVIEDAGGNLYGTTIEGGGGGGYGGIVFKVTSTGAETVLHAFLGGSDGDEPVGSLILDKAGDLYGTTERGGANGNGTVFELTPDGNETILHAFGGEDGSGPVAGLVQDKEGNFYGTTKGGGASGYGTVFKITPGGTLTTLYSFVGGSGDGKYPTDNLIVDTKGNLYGTTECGGYNFNTIPCDSGAGVVFKLTRSGTETVLHFFTGYPDGAAPYGGVIADKQGNLYGTTAYGGEGVGTVYKIAPKGTETVLYTFCQGGGGCADGAYPDDSLIIDRNGNLYGTTNSGGKYTYGGTIFELSQAGKEKVLYSFCFCNNLPREPIGGLITDKSGAFYGTTDYGGNSPYGGYGAVFKFTK